MMMLDVIENHSNPCTIIRQKIQAYIDSQPEMEEYEFVIMVGQGEFMSFVNSCKSVRSSLELMQEYSNELIEMVMKNAPRS